MYANTMYSMKHAVAIRYAHSNKKPDFAAILCRVLMHVRWSPDGGTLAVASEDSFVYLYNCGDYIAKAKCAGHNGPVRTMMGGWTKLKKNSNTPPGSINSRPWERELKTHLELLFGCVRVVLCVLASTQTKSAFQAWFLYMCFRA